MNFCAFQDRVHVNYSYLQISFKMHKEKTSIIFCAYQSEMYEYLFYNYNVQRPIYSFRNIPLNTHTKVVHEGVKSHKCPVDSYLYAAAQKSDLTKHTDQCH